MESGEYLSSVDAAFLFSSKPGWTPLPLIIALGASAECSRWGLSTVSGAKLLNAHSSFRQQWVVVQRFFCTIEDLAGERVEV